jgi:hypothetical protein
VGTCSTYNFMRLVRVATIFILYSYLFTATLTTYFHSYSATSTLTECIIFHTQIYTFTLTLTLLVYTQFVASWWCSWGRWTQLKKDGMRGACLHQNCGLSRLSEDSGGWRGCQLSEGFELGCPQRRIVRQYKHQQEQFKTRTCAA